jgi:CotH protein.
MEARSDMDRKIHIGLCMAVAILASCQRERVPDSIEPEAGPHKVSVTAVQGGDGTRTTISHNDAESRYEFHWDAGDQIDLLEAVPSASGDVVAVYASEPLMEPCDVATFSTSFGPREVEGELLYMASYPSGALQSEGALWDTEKGSFLLPLSIPGVQYPKADSFDASADLLVSNEVVLMERPDELDLSFTRLGTILKLTLTGLEAGTLVKGGSVSLGYACQGSVVYDASTAGATYPDGNDGIAFHYTWEDAGTGKPAGTPLVADASGKAIVWLRLRPGVADRNIHVEVEATVSGEDVQYSRDINLMTRGKSVTFKEGGLTTLSVQVNGAIAGDGVIPKDLQSIPAIYIDTPGGVEINDKVTWIEDTRIRIVGDGEMSLFEDNAAKIRGRGNSSWIRPKKPYYFKLNKKTDLLGTGKSKKYVLLANWMDRTLLRNVVAFEAARRTSIEWTPSGTFVELYLNGVHKGNYWLGEKIEVENGRLNADYLFSLDLCTNADNDQIDFYTDYGYRANKNLVGLPVEIKYPDRDNYPEGFESILQQAKTILNTYGEAIAAGNYADFLDMDSFCDWYLVHELTRNLEPNHPKSCFQYIRDGRFYAGPVWDFDWESFVPGIEGLTITQSLYYRYLLPNQAFFSHMCERWTVLKPGFQSLNQFIDAQADWIRSSEAVNHRLWPINSSNTNGDERLTFQQAVDRMKLSLNQRIEELDKVFGQEAVRAGIEAAGQGTQFVHIDVE